WDSMSTVGAVYDRTFFVDSTKYARLETAAPTVRQLQLFEIESHFELLQLLFSLSVADRPAEGRDCRRRLSAPQWRNSRRRPYRRRRQRRWRRSSGRRQRWEDRRSS